MVSTQQYSSDDEVDGSFVKVFVRVRPTVDSKLGELRYSIPEQRALSVSEGNDALANAHLFSFQKVFDQDHQQADVYKDVASKAVDHIFNGYNSCIFAYGQTGSGKTHTLYGPDGGIRSSIDTDDEGFIPRCLRDIFSRAADNSYSDVSVAVSLCEIYCNRIRDLGKAYVYNRYGFSDIFGPREDETAPFEPSGRPQSVSSSSIKISVTSSTGQTKTNDNFVSISPSSDRLLNDVSHGTLGSESQVSDHPPENNVFDGETSLSSPMTMERFLNLDPNNTHIATLASASSNPKSAVNSTPLTSSPSRSQLLMKRTSELHSVAASHRGGFGLSDSEGIARLYMNENLKVVEDSSGRTAVKGLAIIPVSSVEEAVDVVSLGYQLRATHETKMNMFSSRSHSVLTIHLVQRDRATGLATRAQLQIVDLAGSERLSRTEATGQRLKEAQFVNSSLSQLGKVIGSLQKQQDARRRLEAQVNENNAAEARIYHVPFRDSKLTHILQDSLGGNSYTSLLACVHLRMEDFEESLSTLLFANKCQAVLNRPRVNYLSSEGASLAAQLRALEAETTVLRHQLVQEQLAAALSLTQAMAQLGVQGAPLPCGRFRCSNGFVLGVTREAAANHPYVRSASEWLMPPPSQEDIKTYVDSQDFRAKRYKGKASYSSSSSPSKESLTSGKSVMMGSVAAVEMDTRGVSPELRTCASPACGTAVAAAVGLHPNSTFPFSNDLNPGLTHSALQLPMEPLVTLQDLVGAAVIGMATGRGNGSSSSTTLPPLGSGLLFASVVKSAANSANSASATKLRKSALVPGLSSNVTPGLPQSSISTVKLAGLTGSFGTPQGELSWLNSSGLHPSPASFKCLAKALPGLLADVAASSTPISAPIDLSRHYLTSPNSGGTGIGTGVNVSGGTIQTDESRKLESGATASSQLVGLGSPPSPFLNYVPQASSTSNSNSIASSSPNTNTNRLDNGTSGGAGGAGTARGLGMGAGLGLSIQSPAGTPISQMHTPIPGTPSSASSLSLTAGRGDPFTQLQRRLEDKTARMEELQRLTDAQIQGLRSECDRLRADVKRLRTEKKQAEERFAAAFLVQDSQKKVVELEFKRAIIESSIGGRGKSTAGAIAVPSIIPFEATFSESLPSAKTGPLVGKEREEKAREYERDVRNIAMKAQGRISTLQEEHKSQLESLNHAHKLEMDALKLKYKQRLALANKEKEELSGQVDVLWRDTKAHSN